MHRDCGLQIGLTVLRNLHQRTAVIFFLFLLFLARPVVGEGIYGEDRLQPIGCQELHHILIEILDSHILFGDRYETRLTQQVLQDLSLIRGSRGEVEEGGERADGGERGNLAGGAHASLAGPTPAQWISEIERLTREDCRVLRTYGHVLGRGREKDVLGEFLNKFLLRLDPHSEFLSAAVARDYLTGYAMGYSGIGVYLEEVQNRIVVRKIYRNGAAELSGKVKVGAELIAVDGSFAGEDCRLHCLVKKLMGKEGSAVTITLRQEGATQTLQLLRKSVLIRDISLDVQTQQFRGETIGWIKLNQFYGQAGKDIREVVREFTQNKDPRQNVDAIVLDLRGNTGGELRSMAEVAGSFTPARVVAKGVSRNQHIEYLRGESDFIYTGPLVVLVDRETKSAAEILAGSLQSLQRALVIGTNGTTRTFGKGSLYTWHTVESRQESSGETILKGIVRITSHLMYLPSGICPQATGIYPDIVLPPWDAPKAIEHEENLPYALPKPDLIDPFLYREEPEFAADKREFLMQMGLGTFSQTASQEGQGAVQTEKELAPVWPIVAQWARQRRGTKAAGL